MLVSGENIKSRGEFEQSCRTEKLKKMDPLYEYLQNVNTFELRDRNIFVTIPAVCREVFHQCLFVNTSVLARWWLI